MNNDSRRSKQNGLSSGEIYKELRHRILNNKYNPNEQLRQDELAASFGVSKIPVREALRQLESDRLVEFKPRRGAFVVELTESDILENLEIRTALEVHALTLAIPQMTSDDLQLAEEILKQYAEAKDMERWSELNSRFHLCLYAPCGLPGLLSLLRDVKDRNTPFMRFQITQVAGFDRPHKEHIEILSACKDNDIELGVNLLKKHIENTKKEIKAYFRRGALNKTGT